MTNETLGYSNAQEFRNNNQYEITERLFAEKGLKAIEDKTPPIVANIELISKMESILKLRTEIQGLSLKVAILGISSANGPRRLQDLLKNLGANHVSTTALDISDGIFTDIQATGLDEIHCLLKDARDTGLANASFDLILRDHLGNCCPPNIDRAINHEVNRILKPGGISVVNITTSDLLPESKGREIISYRNLQEAWGNELIEALQNQVYDLDELAAILPNLDLTQLRGPMLEIEPHQSFIIFGEDRSGHGEWFRPLENHLSGWQHTGFEVVECKSREGADSHIPPLMCRRHNIILRKISDI